MTAASTLRQQIQENTVLLTVAAIPTTLTALFAWAWPEALQKIYDAAQSIATPKQLLVMLCISLLANAILITLIISRPKQKPNLKLKYGVYWDSQGNSHCPLCEKPTSQIRWATYQYEGRGTQWHSLHCLMCIKTFLLMNNGQPIHAQEAIKLMQNP